MNSVYTERVPFAAPQYSSKGLQKGTIQSQVARTLKFLVNEIHSISKPVEPKGSVKPALIGFTIEQVLSCGFLLSAKNATCKEKHSYQEGADERAQQKNINRLYYRKRCVL